MVVTIMRRSIIENVVGATRTRMEAGRNMASITRRNITVTTLMRKVRVIVLYNTSLLVVLAMGLASRLDNNLKS
jgi:hypothetical protein